ncbi:MAG: tryptophan synthase subunit alpha [Candidatus Omnitrophica bacterium]|nr:tryptophan synthase subunit alpha [Candidatus Omnitrophota bacterium]
MNRIDKRFKELKRQKRKAFIAYICAGDPDLATTRQLVLGLEKAGVDIVELGVPFSDPLADGPTIQQASQRALKNNVNLPKIFSMIKGLRQETQIPLVLMTYYNPVYHYGVKRFVKDAKAAGADGVIVPDLVPEEAGELTAACTRHGFDPIFLAAPTSTTERIKLISRASKGFIYYVSLTGVTGARKKLPAHITDHIRKIKRITKKPVCIGFGISTPAQVRQLSSFCDGVIVGSAIVNKAKACLPNKSAIPARVEAFVKGLIRGGLR